MATLKKGNVSAEARAIAAVESTKVAAPQVCELFEKGYPRNRLWYLMLLGWSKSPNNPIDLVRAVQRGLPYRYFTRLQQNMSLSLEEMAELTGITYRTLYRRKAEGRLEPDESDRLLRLTRIFGRALELFEGDSQSALSWLHKPQSALEGATPIEMARSEVGASEVDKLIARLEHGIFT